MTKIPIYVISIKNSPRKKNIEKELEKYNFSYIDAVVGADEDSKTIENINTQEWVKKRYGRILSYGEIGCSLSHIKAYQEIIENNIEWAIIFEDDIIIEKNIENLLNIDKKLLNKNTLYILGAQQYLNSEKLIIKTKKESIKVDKDIIFYHTLYSSKYIYRTASYLINKDTAKKILDFTNHKFCIADDWYIFNKYKLFNKIYISNLIYHPEPINNQSTIEKERSANFIKRSFIRTVLSSVKIKLRLAFKIFIERFYDKL
ncbi:glycosyltransferase family 25 protein [Proteus mirabilis]|uniref:glycosyltransferase family 25 protein n=1 Tax=Proteus mirabilis TaxID=584 RepID=UPI001A20EE6A|nr:glycosyltransferase family 25 protein [Proteus mirabilis]MBI6254597.1 glycosyltransferase family 25 protein [Proteus mirabilis]MBI6274891.1 glycosyltransferase family 25 protein [Proteus mirabilis]MBI6517998.1 glycosyltransferase family 25 protein [Proteus mirabilis]MCL8616651.1 glycosyltransferase family 25 protein [Proteus mirabilis]MCT0258080.1 glycosyltransferase family 25 protein [Proteus mirabilis]